MIKKPNNWDNVRTFSDKPKLPVGGYVCTIKKAETQSTNWGDQLLVYIDISDGEYANFYADEYKNNTSDNKKWKGILRLWIPKDDGTDNDEKTKSAFKGFVTAVENSNKNFAWNWEEANLAGKSIGIIFRNEEWEWNNKRGWTVRPFRASSVDSIQDCKYTIPEDKPLKGSSAAAFTQALEEDDSELPF